MTDRTIAHVVSSTNLRTDQGRIVVEHDSDLTVMLDELVVLLRRFVVMTPAQADVVAVWIAATYCLPAFEAVAYLHVTAPTKREGRAACSRFSNASCIGR